MARSHRLGRKGEALAAAHLEERGWRILERGFRSGHKEVDLIIARGDIVAFVEVKTRRSAEFGHPLEGITLKQRAEIAAVARSWLATAAPGTERPTPLLRFDAVAVTIRTGRVPKIEHLEDAWRLG